MSAALPALADASCSACAPPPDGHATLRPAHPRSTPLSALAADAGLRVIGTIGGTCCSGVSVEADDVRPGDLFVGLPGSRSHGAKFSLRAAELGAVAVLTDEAGALLAQGSGLPVIIAECPRGLLGGIAATVYGTGAATLGVDSVTPVRQFAVTGTNGKTSTVHILAALLGQLDIPCGLSSTVERRVGGVSVPSRLTTPEASELHALIARMVESGARATVIEVSAQALTRHRVDGVLFDVAGFTNLSHDHLDEYATLDDYAQAKIALFQPAHTKRGVVSLDSGWGARIVADAGVPVTTLSSTGAPDADWAVDILDEQPHSTEFELRARDGRRLRTRVTLLGRHMAANAALAIVMAVESGIAFDRIRAAVAGGLSAEVPGRAATVGTRRGPKVFVDFSHTPDAFATTLTAVRRVTPGKVLMVMGADGDRDPSKRAEMGRLSAEESDILIVTDHHPRFEDAAEIRAQLLGGAALAQRGARVHEVADPADAIRQAVALADETDSILWAGPGLTGYRDVRGERVPYSSFDDAHRALREAGWA